MLQWVYVVCVLYIAFGALALLVPTPDARVQPSLRPIAFFYRNATFAALIWFALFVTAVVMLVRLNAYHPSEESDEDPLYSTAATASGLVVALGVIMCTVYRLIQNCPCSCVCTELCCCCCTCCPTPTVTSRVSSSNRMRGAVRRLPCFEKHTDTLEERLLSTAISFVLSGMVSAFLPSQSWQHASLSYIGIFLSVMVATAVCAELLAGLIVGIDFAVVLAVDLVFAFEYIQQGSDAWPDRTNAAYGTMLAVMTGIAVFHVCYNVFLGCLAKRLGFVRSDAHSPLPSSDPVSPSRHSHTDESIESFNNPDTI